MKARAVTHLAALAAGVSLAAGWRFAVRPASAPGKDAAPSAVPVAALTEEARRQRNARVLDERLATLRNDRRMLTASPEQAAAEWPHHQRRAAAACEEKIARLQTLSREWTNVPELGGPLTAALQARDADRFTAIFLEWERRDSRAAFRELERRPAAKSFVKAPEFVGSVPEKALLREVQRRDLDSFYRWALLSGQGRLLGLRGDLVAFNRTAECLNDDPDSRNLAQEFLGAWAPENPAAAVQALGHEVSVPLRLPLLRSVYDSSVTLHWLTPEVIQALSTLETDPGGDLADARRKAAEREANRRQEWRDASRPDKRTKDYAELLYDKRVSVEEVDAAMRRDAPNGTEPADGDLFETLFPADPQAVIAWCQTSGKPDDWILKRVKAASGDMTAPCGATLATFLKSAKSVGGWPGQWTSLEEFAGSENVFELWRDLNPCAAEKAEQEMPEGWRAQKR